MVKDPLGERRMDEMLSLGEANLEVLRQLDRWCKHVDATQTSAGMLAAVSGLPIGSFRLSCRHATYTPEAMNLPWTSREFLDHNCRNCPHHEPDGDPSWGRGVLAQVDTDRVEAARRREQLQAAVDELRRQCRAQAGQGRKDDNVTEHQILTWAEQIFDGDTRTSRTAAQHLAEAAKVAPDLFGEAIIGALCVAAPTEAFNEAALPVLAELAGKRPELAEKLTGMAMAALKPEVSPEYCCAILTKTRPDWTAEMRKSVIGRVVMLRNHIRPIGGWPRRDPRCELVDLPPDYALSNAFLAHEYDRDAETVLAVIRDAMRSPDPNRRINGCGVVQGLMSLRPRAAVAVAVNVAASLELVESEFGESADCAACDTLAQAFLVDPEAIDQMLADCIESRNSPVQELLIEVYTRVLGERESSAGEDGQGLVAPEGERVRAAVDVALCRVLRLIQDEQMDVDPLLETVQAVHAASQNHPKLLIEHQAVLLGTMAAWSLQPYARPVRPAIVLPNAEPKPPELVALEKQSRDLSWQSVKHALGDAVSELVEAYPDKFADTLIRSFENLDSKTQYAFKGQVTRLLGALGKHYELLPRVLPTLWAALMDPSSALVRCRGLEVIDACFGHSRQPPPSDVVDILVLHLKDSYNSVHQTAVRVVGDNADWLTEKQAIEALQRLANLVRVYKKEGLYQLESITDALLCVSRRVPQAREWAVNQVLSLIPSGENLLDEKLIKVLIRDVRPAESTAQVVAPTILRWVGGEDGLAEGYRDRTNEGFSWLHSLPPGPFEQVRALVIEQAITAVKDPRRAMSFASLFAAHEDYKGEREVLAQATSHLPAGRRFEEMVKTMETLADAAGRNAAAGTSAGGG